MIKVKEFKEELKTILFQKVDEALSGYIDGEEIEENQAFLKVRMEIYSWFRYVGRTM